MMSNYDYQIVHNIIDLKEALANLVPQPERHLGEFLVEDGAISEHQLAEVLKQKTDKPNIRIGKLMVQMGVASPTQVSIALGKKFGIPFVQLREFRISPEILKLVPTDLALQYNALPLAEVDGILILAMEDPMDWEARDVIRFHANRMVDAVIASSQDISLTLSEYYSHQQEIEMLDEVELDLLPRYEPDFDNEELAHLVEQKPIVRMINSLLQQAVMREASDINIRPETDRVNVYFRIDGKLQFVRSLNRHMLLPLVSRIKVIGEMDIAEHHLPQDGHARLKRGTNEVDLRLSIIPTVTGESVVIRILDTEVGLKPLTSIGFDERELRILRDLVSRSFGIFLVTGPTGSGKSTTLYSVLNELKKKGPHIITVEDPVEYHMSGVEQIQILNARGYTFAESLRHILRHDPDVIMIGEIRDVETARIANKAALTGHTVLSTLHTNDAASSITRLLDMGIEPYLLSATMLGGMAQRLIRLNCTHCTKPAQADAEILEELGLSGDEVFYQGEGCPSCNNTGYHGRVAVCELLPVTNKIRRLMTAGVDAQTIKEAAVEEGMVTLTAHALELARQGKTSLEEVYSIRLE
jgi:type IV pilus assembly protein PilB